MSAAVNKIAYKVGELELHKFKSDRVKNTSITPVADTLAVGEQKLQLSTLAMFNRKVKGMLGGHGFDVEEDEIPPTNFQLSDKSDDGWIGA